MKPLIQDYRLVLRHEATGELRYKKVRTDSAANAMGIALRRNAGCVVCECYTGGTFAEDGRFTDQYAKLEYEVPPHKPYEKVAKAKLPAPASLFDDEAIRTESEKALTRAGHGIQG